MNQVMYVYPGTFCPPTEGHRQIVLEACEIFPEVIILCSVNKDKTPWFPPEKCKQLWYSYNLPTNVRFMTLQELTEEQAECKREIVMIRGIRNAEDLIHERAVMGLNSQSFGIKNYFYRIADPKFAHISSSLARQCATDLELEKLSELMSPGVVTALLEYVLDIKNIIMVVGRTGSGKSTFLKILSGISSQKNVHVNTDDFNHALRPEIDKRFGADNVLGMAIQNDEELKKFVAPLWLKMLAQTLRGLRGSTNVFVEIPYGLQPDKRAYKFIGNKVIYVGCQNPETNNKRLANKGASNLSGFIHKVPDLDESFLIAHQENLDLVSVNTDCSMDELYQKAGWLSQWLKNNSFRALARSGQSI